MMDITCGDRRCQWMTRGCQGMIRNDGKGNGVQQKQFVLGNGQVMRDNDKGHQEG